MVCTTNFFKTSQKLQVHRTPEYDQHYYMIVLPAQQDTGCLLDLVEEFGYFTSEGFCQAHYNVKLCFIQIFTFPFIGTDRIQRNP